MLLIIPVYIGEVTVAKVICGVNNLDDSPYLLYK